MAWSREAAGMPGVIRRQSGGPHGRLEHHLVDDVGEQGAVHGLGVAARIGLRGAIHSL